MLTDAERQKILVEWNNTATNYPKDKCIHHLFEEQVERTPDATALVMAEDKRTVGGSRRQVIGEAPVSSLQSLTYAELNARANQLAHYLQNLGVGPDVLVGVCVERSIEMIVGLLGILKAGGVYVPLDPNYPSERFTFMLADADPLLIVTTLPYHKLFSPMQRLVCLDTDVTEIEEASAHNPCADVTASHLAYIIYTSGSTGQPKGVLLEHGGLSNLTQAQMCSFDIRHDSRVLQLVSPNFDVSISDIAMALCAGATLVLATPDQHQLGDALTQMLREQAITHLELTPAVLATINPEAVPDLQTIIVGGEASPPKLVAQWTQGRRFFNAYGPTETTVCATIMDCATWYDWQQSPPIGRPLANTQVYVLDEEQQPVPIGILGELYIGGVGVARGYLNRPQLTDEKFIANPFGVGRLYRTGDLARWRPDGTLEFLRRIDDQVKIRGFRIELGEIEHALLAQEGVSEAVVMAREDNPGDKRLVAYLVMAAQGHEGAKAEDDDQTALRQVLAQRLPAYMVPSAFVVLDALPLTPNGKVDRKALPAPETTQCAIQKPYTAPRTPTEEKLVGIWQSVLGRARVGIDDNFFSLGGHSLLAIQLITHIRTALQIDLALSVLFKTPTVAGLAEWIDQQTTRQPCTAIQPVIRAMDLPLSFAQEEVWLLSQSPTLGSVHQYNTVSLLRFMGQLDLEALRQSFNALITRHEILRTSYRQTTDAAWAVAQCIAPTATVDLPVLDLSQLADQAKADEIERLRVAEEKQRLDLTQTPSFRLTLARLTPEEHILIHTGHHISSDNWSWLIMLRELEVFYTAFIARKPASVALLPFQYADYAYWQRHFFTPDVLAERRHYWERLLAKPVTRLNLPTDRPRPQTEKPQAHIANTETFALSSALSAILKELSQQHSASLSMLLLAAYAALLYRYSGCDDLLIASPTNKRHQPGTELLIGHFSGLAFLRINLAGAPSFVDLLTHVKSVILMALSNQDINLRQLLQVTGADWLAQGRPQFQAAFNFLQTAQMTESAWSGLTITQVNTGRSHIVADVALTIYEESANGDNYQIHGEWIYRQDLFESATIRQMIENFKRVLEAFIAEPTQTITLLPLSVGTQSSLESGASQHG